MRNENPVLVAQKSHYQQNRETPDLQKEFEDLMRDQDGSQNTDAASMLAALMCLAVGSGPEEV